MGVKYACKSQTLTLELAGPPVADWSGICRPSRRRAASLPTSRGEIVLDHPHACAARDRIPVRRSSNLSSQPGQPRRASACRRKCQRSHASPDLEELTFKVTETQQASPREQIDARADEAEFLFLSGPGPAPHRHAQWQSALLSKSALSRWLPMQGVSFSTSAARPSCRRFKLCDGRSPQADPGSAMQNARLQFGAGFRAHRSSDRFQRGTEGHILRHANTSGPAQIIIAQAECIGSNFSPQQTVVTAGRFDADFTHGRRAQSPASRSWRSQCANCELKPRPAGKGQHQ